MKTDLGLVFALLMVLVGVTYESPVFDQMQTSLFVILIIAGITSYRMTKADVQGRSYLNLVLVVTMTGVVYLMTDTETKLSDPSTVPSEPFESDSDDSFPDGLSKDTKTALMQSVGKVSRGVAVPKVVVKTPQRDVVVNMMDEQVCLNVNAYFEARDQSVEGIKTQMEATLNRVGKFGNKTVCDAVTNSNRLANGNLVKDKCHFSWYCDGNPNKVIGSTKPDFEKWQLIKKLGKEVSTKHAKGKTSSLDHYCTLEVEKKTSWVKFMKHETRTVVGDHVFWEHDPVKFEANWKKVTATRLASN